jgi:ATP-dependent Clp protease adaptor protein ClpS
MSMTWNMHLSPEEALLEEVLYESGPIKEIVLHNDDVNTFDHVIDCLVGICDHDPIQAEQCAWIVHFNGKCSVKRGTFDALEPLCTSLCEQGLSADIQ